MTDEELAAVKARAEKATSGPWESYSVPGRNRSAAGYAAVEVAETEVQVTRDVGGWFDADFIAHARTDVPALVAEVARLQGEEDHIQDALGETQRLMGELNDALIHKLRDAEAEVARLQGIIDQARAAVASAVNGPRLTIDGYDVRLGVLTAILDGEEQS